MTFLPDGFDPRAEIIGALNLVLIDAPSGIARFLVGQDALFTDVNGLTWAGSSLIDSGPLEWSRDATAPASSMTLTYFQDPSEPDLIEELRASGDNVLQGRRIEFYVQPIGTEEEFYAPRFAPVLVATRTGGSLTFEAQGETIRRFTLAVEGPFRGRKARRSFYYTQPDHEALIGEDNPSLEFVPTDPRTDESLFG